MLYPHHRQIGCDEGPVGEYGISSSEDRLALFAIDVARQENMAMRLARVCPQGGRTSRTFIDEDA